jgi:hypothetical protein
VSELPPPFVDPEVDLTGLESMPLFCARLVDSDLVGLSTGEEFKAAFLLWAKAWTQRPAGSLPTNPKILARYAGVSVEFLEASREIILRGWTECSNGRLYHPTVAEAAMIAWNARVSYEKRVGSFSQKQSERARRGWIKRKASKPNAVASATAEPGQSRFGNANEREGKGRDISPLPPSGEGGSQEGSFLDRVLEVEAPKASKPKAARVVCTLPDDWASREDERAVAIGDLKMTSKEFEDAEAEFREWASKNGRRIRGGSAPNWDLAFRNHLRSFARRIGSSFRREAPERIPSKSGTAIQPLPIEPDWWASAAHVIFENDAAFWTAYASRCKPDPSSKKPALICESGHVSDRVEIRLRTLGLEIPIRHVQERALAS